jgi:hypothetical protein
MSATVPKAVLVTAPAVLAPCADAADPDDSITQVPDLRVVEVDLGESLIHLTQHLTDAVVSPTYGRLAPEWNQKRRMPPRGRAPSTAHRRPGGYMPQSRARKPRRSPPTSPTQYLADREARCTRKISVTGILEAPPSLSRRPPLFVQSGYSRVPALRTSRRSPRKPSPVFGANNGGCRMATLGQRLCQPTVRRTVSGWSLPQPVLGGERRAQPIAPGARSALRPDRSRSRLAPSRPGRCAWPRRRSPGTPRRSTHLPWPRC